MAVPEATLGRDGSLVWLMKGGIDWLAEAARHERKRQHREAPPAAGTQRCSHACEQREDEVAAILSGEQAQELGELEALLAEIVDETESHSGSDADREAPASDDGQGADRIATPLPSQQVPSASSSSDMLPDVFEGARLHAARMACIAESVGWSSDEICRRLAFEKAEVPWRLVQRGPPSGGWDVDGAVLGRLTVTFGGRTLQAVCANPRHSPRCKLLLNMRGDMPATEARLLRWLIVGVTVSRDDHMRGREVIKAEHTAKS